MKITSTAWVQPPVEQWPIQINRTPEKEEYNDLQINFLDRKINMWYEEISLNDFMIDRNHPNQNLYRTDSMSDLPNYRVIEDLEEQVKELELKNSKLRKELN